jgi:hypothetical protein
MLKLGVFGLITIFFTTQALAKVERRLLHLCSYPGSDLLVIHLPVDASESDFSDIRAIRITKQGGTEELEIIDTSVEADRVTLALGQYLIHIPPALQTPGGISSVLYDPSSWPKEMARVELSSLNDAQRSAIESKLGVSCLAVLRNQNKRDSAQERIE